ncbi:hypothetical protein [Moorella sp. Hama-1]|uniref:hypothetical protein n=1 Tax=Moorella sp. Hama-1 TaxID=2138101 RepID=UPI001914C449|nr:hypothetical protein [Moorella sp. Hama-1]BCV19958.1 hypothetical protein hamaS1_00270 [Moorella sp. Hama-1]
MTPTTPTAQVSSSYGKILEKARVAVTPGIDFGRNCEGYLRLSYANPLANIKEGLDRLEEFLAGKEGQKQGSIRAALLLCNDWGYSSLF